MGDPKKQHRKYEKPAHPWQKERLDEESKLKREYGLKNKSEIWKARSFSKHVSNNAKRIIRGTDSKSEDERIALLKKSKRLALISESGVLNDILSITEEDILKRRLQTIVFNKGFARSIKQARQFIIHGHVMVGDSNITVPSYLVTKDEEEKITFKDRSSLSDEEHPERKIGTEEVVADKEFIEETKQKEEERVKKATEETEKEEKTEKVDEKKETAKQKEEKKATEETKKEEKTEKVDKKEEPAKQKEEKKATEETEKEEKIEKVDTKQEPVEEKEEKKATEETENEKKTEKVDKKEEPVEEKEGKKEKSTESKSE
jgi:small subunit ribosomal protein S4